LKRDRKDHYCQPCRTEARRRRADRAAIEREPRWGGHLLGDLLRLASG
jgi:hypothetical protein